MNKNVCTSVYAGKELPHTLHRSDQVQHRHRSLPSLHRALGAIALFGAIAILASRRRHLHCHSSKALHLDQEVHLGFWAPLCFSVKKGPLGRRCPGASSIMPFAIIPSAASATDSQKHRQFAQHLRLVLLEARSLPLEQSLGNLNDAIRIAVPLHNIVVQKAMDNCGYQQRPGAARTSAVNNLAVWLLFSEMTKYTVF